MAETEIEAKRMAIERLPDEREGTKTTNGGYEVWAMDTEGEEHEFQAQALNINGQAMSTQAMSIGEHKETVTLRQEVEGGYLNVIVPPEE